MKWGISADSPNRLQRPNNTQISLEGGPEGVEGAVEAGRRGATEPVGGGYRGLQGPWGVARQGSNSDGGCNKSDNNLREALPRLTSPSELKLRLQEIHLVQRDALPV